jgi:hypothetical protein
MTGAAPQPTAASQASIQREEEDEELQGMFVQREEEDEELQGTFVQREESDDEETEG